MTDFRLNRRSFLAGLSAAASVPLAAASYRIWDLHCHIYHVDGATLRDRMATLIKFADRVGIERIVTYMGDPIHTNPTPEQFRAENDQVLESLKGFEDRAFGFVYLNPNYLKESLQEFDRCVR